MLRWSGLIAEGDKVSIGRLMIWVVFGILVWLWVAGKPTPPSLVEALWGLLLYNGGKKMADPLLSYVQGKQRVTPTISDKPFVPPVITTPPQVTVVDTEEPARELDDVLKEAARPATSKPTHATTDRTSLGSEEEESYTSRLLEAKKKVWKEKRQDSE